MLRFLLLVPSSASIYLFGAGRGSWTVLLWCDAQSDVVGQAAGENEPAFLLSGRRLGRPKFRREDKHRERVYMYLSLLEQTGHTSIQVTE